MMELLGEIYYEVNSWLDQPKRQHSTHHYYYDDQILNQLHLTDDVDLGIYPMQEMPHIYEPNSDYRYGEDHFRV